MRVNRSPHRVRAVVHAQQRRNVVVSVASVAFSFAALAVALKFAILPASTERSVEQIARGCTSIAEFTALERELELTPAGELERDDATTTAAFLGDSYTQGSQASSLDVRWSSIVTATLGWQELNAGVRGTGYAATYGLPGEVTQGTYAERILSVAAADPDIVIISGGRNDLRCDISEVAAGAELTFSQLRERLPDTAIYVLDPWWDSGEAPAGLLAVQSTVEAAAARHGIIVLASGQPLIDTKLVSIDGIHPNDAGYAALAAAVLAVLPVAG